MEREGMPVVVVVAEPVVHWPSCERLCLCVRRTRTWYRREFVIASGRPALRPRAKSRVCGLADKSASYYIGSVPAPDGAAEAWCREAIVEAALPRYAGLLVEIGRGDEASFEVLSDLVDGRFDFRPAFQPMMSAVLGLLADGVHVLGLPLRTGG